VVSKGIEGKKNLLNIYKMQFLLELPIVHWRSNCKRLHLNFNNCATI
jgi:hypothetical protein